MKLLALLGSVFTLLLPISVLAMQVILQWDANIEPDLAGYKIYYRIGNSGPPYDGTGAVQGPSPITITLADDEEPDPSVVQYTLTGLVLGVRYYFAVTAYDSEVPFLESDYSNEVSTDGVTGFVPAPPGSLRFTQIISVTPTGVIIRITLPISGD